MRSTRSHTQLLCAALVAVVGGLTVDVRTMQSSPAAATSNVARDPQVAVQEEFDAAKRRGTVAAFELFIARHPDNSLTAAARRQLRILRVKLR